MGRHRLVDLDAGADEIHVGQQGVRIRETQISASRVLLDGLLVALRDGPAGFDEPSETYRVGIVAPISQNDDDLRLPIGFGFGIWWGSSCHRYTNRKVLQNSFLKLVIGQRSALNMLLIRNCRNVRAGTASPSRTSSAWPVRSRSSDGSTWSRPCYASDPKALP